jgi:NAD(P)H-dependent flavin oxidoreductase YrpB (nitropropane dioxygenase family)
MRTRVSELLGVELPILAFSHCRDVVAAVSKAGGFGVLGVAGHDPKQLEVDLDWIDAEVGDRPYGVDVIIPAKYAGSDSGGYTSKQVRDLIPEEHRAFVEDIMARYGVPPLADRDRRERGDAPPMTAEAAHPLVDIALSHDIGLIANALGPPPPWLIEQAHSRDVPVAALAGKRAHAERHVAAGVDLIVAQGYEAGGHTGEIATMVLVPEVVDAVAPVPVVAAGGIASGRQIAAALALGAEGVWCGSVWLTTEEAETHPVVKEKFLAASSSDTLRSRSRTGKPARQLRSAWTDEWERADTPAPLGMPMQPLLVAEASVRIDRAAANHEGARQLANYFVGQVVGSMNQVKPVRRVIEEMVQELIDATESMAARLEG